MKKLIDGVECKNGHVQGGENRRANGRCKQCELDKKFKHFLNTGRVLPPDSLANLKPYKEPLTPVKDGYGYQGTLAQSVGKTHLQCHICGYFFPNVGTHVGKVHSMSANDYRAKFELSRTTPLVADIPRANLRSAALKVTPAEKARRLKIFKSATRRNDNVSIRKSLEAKNKEGRCYYQLLDKINSLATKLEKVPTRREFAKEYGEGYLGSLYGAFGSWTKSVELAGLKPRSTRSGSPEWSKEKVAEIMREFLEIEGRPPRASDMNRGLIPSSGVFRRLFNGSIIEARQYAGMGQYDYINEDGSTEKELYEALK